MVKTSTLIVLILAAILTACSSTTALPTTSVPPTVLAATATSSPVPTLTSVQVPTPTILPTEKPLVPRFEHIVLILFENREFDTVIDNPAMPYFNQLSKEYTLLTQYFAVAHPSLPNYLALISGSTQGLTYTCVDCFFNVRTLPDLLEEAGLTWKTYQEDMLAPCSTQETLTYFQKHNPFVYFDPIRLNMKRCQASVVPLIQLDADLQTNTLANYIFITPNICNDAHDCDLDVADAWLKSMMGKLMQSPQLAHNSLIVITWDEGQGDKGCCGIQPGGGRIATILVSDLVKQGFTDDTSYTHYSLLRTIASAWGLPLLGHASDPETSLITLPWK